METERVSHFTRFNNLDIFCSGGVGKQTGEAIALHLHNILVRVQRLDRILFSSSVSSTLGSVPIPPSTSQSDSKIAAFSSELSLVKSNIINLTSRFGQDAIEIGGVQFQSLSQTIAWVRSDLPSNCYSVFQDIMTLLDLIGTSNFSHSDFLDG